MVINKLLLLMLSILFLIQITVLVWRHLIHSFHHGQLVNVFGMLTCLMVVDMLSTLLLLFKRHLPQILLLVLVLRVIMLLLFKLSIKVKVMLDSLLILSIGLKMVRIFYLFLMKLLHLLLVIVNMEKYQMFIKLNFSHSLNVIVLVVFC